MEEQKLTARFCLLHWCKTDTHVPAAHSAAIMLPGMMILCFEIQLFGMFVTQ